MPCPARHQVPSHRKDRALRGSLGPGTHQQPSVHICYAAGKLGTDPVVAVDGDLVTLHYDCRDDDGKVRAALEHPWALACKGPPRRCYPAM